MFRVEKTFSVSSAHYLPGYSGKCQHMHGHNWQIEVTCESEVLNKLGMVVDFAEIKKKVSDIFDHGLLNDVIENPTAENIAKYICDIIPKCVRVEVEETEGSIAIYEKE